MNVNDARAGSEWLGNTMLDTINREEAELFEDEMNVVGLTSDAIAAGD